MISFGLIVGAFISGVVFSDKIKALFKTYVSDKVIAFVSKYLPPSLLP